MNEWIDGAPKATDFIVEPVVTTTPSGAVFPTVAMAFRGLGDDDDPAITVAFVGTPSGLRLFVREIQKAVNVAEQMSRDESRKRRAENDGEE
jgi:hypothetical protein